MKMKKGLLALTALACIGLSIASCGKTYTCRCTSLKADGTVTDVQLKSVDGTKDKAERDCKAMDNVYQSVTTTCLLDE
jgi:hypothetical protein